uniref:Uncharacterized protein n=1 Tax=Sexangularia sp. CB-2014 TaxID=1486929 RepID=A0A7S1V9S1_9EUKA
MTKKPTKKVASPRPRTRKGTASSVPKSAELASFARSYSRDGSVDHRHERLLHAVAQEFGILGDCSKPIGLVVYPGCHRHVTFSLYFPRLLYIDADSRIAPFYQDSAVRDFVRQNRKYSEEPRFSFLQADYTTLTNGQVTKESDTAEDARRLFASLSAGPVVNALGDLARPGDLLLASDAHADARVAFVSGEWDLVAVWDDDEATLRRDEATLARPFRVKKTGELISKAQVEESVRVGAVARRSFRLAYEPRFTVFQKK